MHHSTEFIALLTSFDPGITYSVCTWRLPLKEATEYNACTALVHGTAFFPFQDGEEV